MNDTSEASPRRIGLVMLAIAWVIVIILLSISFQQWWNSEENPNQQVASLIDADGTKVVELERNRFNAYMSVGTINGTAVIFLLDTGASDVVISTKLATKIGLRKGPATVVVTANGRVKVNITNIKELTIGNIRLINVRALINPGMFDEAVLLGMSALKRIEFTQRENKLILRQHPVQ